MCSVPPRSLAITRMGSDDVVVTILTDSMEMYGSRLEELSAEHGEYTTLDAAGDYHRYVVGLKYRSCDRTRFTGTANAFTT